MKRTLFTFIVVLLATTFSNAQEAQNPADMIDPNNLAQLLALPKSSKDSMITLLKKNRNAAKKMKVDINGKDRSDDFLPVTKKFMVSLNDLMIATLESSDPAIAGKNQQKYNEFQKKLEYDMERFSEKLEYQDDRKEIIDRFETGTYNSTKEKREARKDMNRHLKKLKADFKEKQKSAKRDKDND